MMKFDQVLMNFVRKDLDRNLIPMLLGEPGIGKSSWLSNLANLMHTKCFVLPCNQLADKADLTGARLVPVTDDKGQTVSYKQVFYPHAIIHDAIAYATEHPRETPILFLDELNRTTPDVTSEALSIPTMRAIGSIELPANLRVVIAGNDKGNVTSLDEASISRFVLYHVAPDVNTFLGLDPELNPFVRSVLEKHPETIFCKHVETIVANNDDADDDEMVIEDIIDDGEDMNQITTPRTLSALSRWLNTFNNQELLAAMNDVRLIDGMQVSVLQEAIEGHVGNTDFTKYLLAEIASGVTTTNNQAQVIQLTKPPVYDAFKACPDRTALNDFIGNMSDSERSATLAYLLYEREDNSVFIQAIAPACGNPNPTDVQNINDLSKVNGLDAENVHVLLGTNTSIATLLSMLLSNY